MPDLSIIIPVYFNAPNLEPLYQDIKEKILDPGDIDAELILVDDGSGDDSWNVMKRLAAENKAIHIYHLSRNFGSHAAILCGLDHCTGNCAVIKAADMQEPTELIREMYASWQHGNNVVLAVRQEREENKSQIFFANFYYWIVQKFALPKMPKNGFDIYLLDRKVIQVLKMMDEKNSALTGQILWSGFKTDTISYTRKARKIGKSRWTLRKKIRLVSNTLYSFSTIPISIVSSIGALSVVAALIWTIVVLINKFSGNIPVTGFTTLVIFQLFSFGIIMVTLGILGGYLWRTFDASRERPVYIVEDSNEVNHDN